MTLILLNQARLYYFVVTMQRRDKGGILGFGILGERKEDRDSVGLLYPRPEQVIYWRKYTQGRTISWDYSFDAKKWFGGMDNLTFEMYIRQLSGFKDPSDLLAAGGLKITFEARAYTQFGFKLKGDILELPR